MLQSLPKEAEERIFASFTSLRLKNILVSDFCILLTGLSNLFNLIKDTLSTLLLGYSGATFYIFAWDAGELFNGEEKGKVINTEEIFS